jgi:hypothetical protein
MNSWRGERTGTPEKPMVQCLRQPLKIEQLGLTLNSQIGG